MTLEKNKSPLTLEQDKIILEDMRNSISHPSRKLSRVLRKIEKRLLADVHVK